MLQKLLATDAGLAFAEKRTGVAKAAPNAVKIMNGDQIVTAIKKTVVKKTASKNKKSYLHVAMRLALLSTVSMTCAMADDESQNDTGKDERIQVTGSRIKRIDAEGANPVFVIDRSQLDLKAETSVAEVLTKLTSNSFGSFRTASNNSWMSQATVDLRGLGSARTLVLINGRRMANSPIMGASGQNLSTIPFAAVERIEILTDGASAVYGSDAIAGVVNIIMRENFSDSEVTAYRKVPQGDTRSAEGASITGGVQSDNSHSIYSLEFERNDIVFQRENALTYSEGPFTTSGRSPYGNWRPVTGIDADGNDEVGDVTGSLDCPGDFTYPLSGSKCRYRYSTIASDLPDSDRLSGYFNYVRDLSDGWEWFNQARFARAHSFSISAPAPFDAASDTPNRYGIRIDESNPINPTRDPRSGYQQPVPVYVTQTRPELLGPRNENQTNYQYDIISSIKGSVGKYDVEFGAQYNSLLASHFGRNFAMRREFTELVTEGRFNPFNPNDPINSTPFIPAGMGQAILPADYMRATVSRDGSSTFKSADATISGSLFALPAGDAAFAAGVERRDEIFALDADAQSNAGNVFGSSGGASHGDRSVGSIYAEFDLPILKSLTSNIAVRKDDYSDVGGRTSPKVSLRWQPISNLVIRGGVSAGFRAPSLDDLHGGNSEGYPNITDLKYCRSHQIPDDDCPTSQYLVINTSNAQLAPELSRTKSLGIVYEPIDHLSLSVDFADIRLTDAISGISADTVLDAELNGNSLPQGTKVNRLPTGELASVETTTANVGETRVRVVDIASRYRIDLGTFGNLRSDFYWSHVFNWKSRSTADSPLLDYAGDYGSPKDRASLLLGWDRGAHGFAVTIDYIAAQAADEFQDGDKLVLEGHTDAREIYGLQYSYTAPWSTKLTLGVDNLESKAPPEDKKSVTNYNGSLYDVFGRTYYIRLTQHF